MKKIILKIKENQEATSFQDSSKMGSVMNFETLEEKNSKKLEKHENEIKILNQKTKEYFNFFSIFLLLISIGFTSIIFVAILTVGFRNQDIYSYDKVIFIILTIFACVIVSLFLYCLFYYFVFKNKK